MKSEAPDTATLTPPPGADVWSAAGSLLRMRTQWSPVTPGPRPALLPLTFAQERIWSLVQLEARSPVYNVPLAWRLTGPLDPQALERVLRSLAARHEVLRLIFLEQAGRPAARLAEGTDLTMRVVDLRTIPTAAREAEARRLALEDICVPFDLTARPPVRATLFWLGETEHWLVWTLHQIIVDGWSIRVLGRELGEGYIAEVARVAPGWRALPVQYVDFAQWQREWLNDTTLAEALGFWRQLLAEPCRPLALPWDHPEARQDTGASGRAQFRLSRLQLDTLKKIGRAEGATPFMLLHALWTALLHRVSGQKDILLFASLASRTQADLQTVVGLVANVLPLRTQVPPAASFRELLRASSAVVAGGLAHQVAPFERIAESLQATGGASLFQMLLIYQNAPPTPPEGGDLHFDWLTDVDNGLAKFDLLLDVANGPEGVCGSLKYRADRFDAATIEGLLQDWQALVDQIIATPDAPLTQFVPQRIATHETKGATIPTKPRAELPREEYRDGLEMKLAAIWQKVLGVKQVQATDSFFELGGHSMRAVQLFIELEKQLDRRLPIATLFRAPTFGQLLGVLREGGCETRWPGLVPIQPRGNRPPFVWLHTLGGGGGGGLLRYRALANLLGPDQPSFGIEAPHEPFTRIEEMATAYIEMLKTLQPEGPYYLGGYCFAANVAFEMACQLEAQGEKVAMLALLEAMPPEALHRRTPLTLKNSGAFARNLCYWTHDFLRRPLRVVVADLKRLSGRLVATVARKLRGQNGALPNFRELGEIVDIHQYPAGFRHYAEVHYRAMGSYRPGVYHGRITLFRARTRSLLRFDPQLGWGAHTTGGITVKVVPGKHEDFLEEPLVEGLADQFRIALLAAQENPR